MVGDCWAWGQVKAGVRAEAGLKSLGVGFGSLSR